MANLCTGFDVEREIQILKGLYDIHWTALAFKKYLKNQNNITRNFILSLNRVTRLENWKLSQKIGGKSSLLYLPKKWKRLPFPYMGMHSMFKISLRFQSWVGNYKQNTNFDHRSKMAIKNC